MATYTDKNGTTSADKLTYTKAGTWKAGAGNDTIYVKSTKALTLYGEAGNDVIHISAGSNHIIDVGAGNDTVNLTAGTVKTLKLVSGTNTVNASKGTITTLTGGTGVDKLNVKGATVTTANFGNGNDVLTVTSGTVTNANLGNGNDSVTISGGTIKTLTASAGNNTVNVKGGTLTTLKAGSGTDTINVSGGTLSTLTGTNYVEKLNISNGTVNSASLGGGNDIVSITKGTLKTVDLGAGNDSVTISGGTITTLKGNSGTNTINVKGGTVTTLTGGSGVDTLNFSGGTITNQVNMGAGDDKVNISGGTKIKVAGGAGSDTYKITNLSAGKSYTIINTGNSATEKDVLDLSAYKSTDLTFTSTASGDIVLHHSSGALVTVQGIMDSDNNLKSAMTFKFKDKGSLNITKASDIINTLVLDAAGSADGTVYNDVFVIAKRDKNFHTSIKDYTAEDKLDFTAFNDANYSFGFKTSGDNLVVYLYKNDNGTVTKQGYVNVENYFVTDSKLNTILTMDGVYSFEVDEDGNVELSAQGDTLVLDMATVGEVNAVGDISNLVLKSYGIMDLQYDNTVGMVISTTDNKNKVSLLSEGNPALQFADMTVSLEQLHNIIDNNFVFEDGSTVILGLTKKNDISFELDNGKLIIKNSDGQGGIYKVGEDITQIKLQDGMLKLAQGDNYLNTTSDKDVFVMAGTEAAPMDVVIEGSGNMNTLDFTAYGDESKVELAGSKNANDLALSVTVDGSFIGNITLKDYYLGDSFGNAGNVGQQIKFYKDGLLQAATVYASDANGGYADLDMLREFWESEANVLYIGTEGNDKVISTDAKDIIYTGAGNDTITIADAEGCDVKGGLGSDTYAITGLKANGEYFIDNSDSVSGDGDKLVLKQQTLNEFAIEQNGDESIVLVHNNGARITVTGWDENPLSRIEFADRVAVLGNNADNTLTVAESNVLVNGYAGNDKITVKAGSEIELLGGSGSDDYSITALAENGSYVIDNSGNSIEDSDTVSFKNFQSKDFTVTKEQGNMLFTHKNGAVITIKDWDSNPLASVTFADGVYDGYILEAMSEGYVVGGASITGNASGNIVELSSGTVGTVYGGYSADGNVGGNIVRLAGTVVVDGDVYGSYTTNGNVLEGDIITVGGDAKVTGTVYGASEDDVIVISSTKATRVEGRYGDDIITVEGGSGHIISGGAGIDTYIIDWSKAKNITIDNKNDNTSNQDFLQISNVNSTTFSFSYADDILTMSSGGNHIKIQGWKDHAVGGILFEDKELSKGDIDKKIGLSSSGSVNAAAGRGYDANNFTSLVFYDNILGRTGEASVTVQNVGSSTVLDFSNMIVDPACIEFARVNSDLHITVCPNNEDWDELGEVHVVLQGYLSKTNVQPMLKLSNFEGDRSHMGSETITLAVGASSADTINLDSYGADEIMYYTNGGADKITGSKGDIFIYGDSSAENVYLTGAGRNMVYTNAGNDTVVINGNRTSSYSDVCTGSGKDTIVLNNLRDANGWGDSGDDVFLVSNVSGMAGLAGNEGHDKYFVSIDSVEYANLYLNEEEEELKTGDTSSQDTLVICGSKLSRLMLGYSEDNPSLMVIDEYFGGDDWRGNISLDGWKKNPLKTVKVLDKAANKAYSIAFSSLQKALQSNGGEVCLANVSGWTNTTLTSDTDYTQYVSLQNKITGNK